MWSIHHEWMIDKMHTLLDKDPVHIGVANNGQKRRMRSEEFVDEASR
jgi:hypothetical protein